MIMFPMNGLKIMENVYVRPGNMRVTEQTS